MMARPPSSRSVRSGVALVAVLAALCLSACRSPQGARRSADRQAYRIISEKSPAVPGMTPSFSLELPQDAPSAAKVAGAARSGTLAPLSLADAAVTAAASSRDFQRQKEGLYLKALDLTYQRYLFSAHFSGVLSGMFEATSSDRSVEGGATFGISKALSTGADLGLTLSGNFLRFLSGDPRQSAEGILRFTLTQPLARGAGKRVAQENLTQAERDVLYELRSFVRYRRQFLVSVASDYFRVLQQKDIVANERMNLENLTSARQRAQMLFEAGRLPGIQVAQAEQDELRARNRWISAQQAYQSSLNEFKITLGLPPDTPLELDAAELSRLSAQGLEEVSLTLQKALDVALARRLDLANAADQARDAERKVTVAENSLKSDIDLSLSADLGTDRAANRYGGGIQVDLPLDRLSERNQYRRSLIEVDRARRAYELLRDRVVQQIDGGWRSLEEARVTYEIQLRSVELAQQRVENTALLIEAGRAQMRDLLEAQEALVGARNALTAALVNHRVAMLELWRDMEVLTFQNQAFTQEPLDNESSEES